MGVSSTHFWPEQAQDLIARSRRLIDTEVTHLCSKEVWYRTTQALEAALNEIRRFEHTNAWHDISSAPEDCTTRVDLWIEYEEPLGAGSGRETNCLRCKRNEDVWIDDKGLYVNFVRYYDRYDGDECQLNGNAPELPEHAGRIISRVRATHWRKVPEGPTSAQEAINAKE